jgi:hypothetical protein
MILVALLNILIYICLLIFAILFLFIVFFSIELSRFHDLWCMKDM